MCERVDTSAGEFLYSKLIGVLEFGETTHAVSDGSEDFCEKVSDWVGADVGSTNWTKAFGKKVLRSGDIIVKTEVRYVL